MKPLVNKVGSTGVACACHIWESMCKMNTLELPLRVMIPDACGAYFKSSTTVPGIMSKNGCHIKGTGVENVLWVSKRDSL